MTTPILLNPKLLSEPVAEEIRAWLYQPAAQKYLSFLRDKAAELTAEVGNAQVSGSDINLVDAKALAVLARAMVDTITILQTHSARDYNFQIAELKTNPQTQK